MDNEQTKKEYQRKQNADLQYLLEMFDGASLNLTIVEESEEKEKSLTEIHRKRTESSDGIQCMSQETYKNSIIQLLKSERQLAIEFIDSAIRYMNHIRKAKIADIFKELNEFAVEETLDVIISKENLIDAVQSQILNKKLNTKTQKLLIRVNQILNKKGELTKSDKVQIRGIFQQIDIL